MRKDANCGGCVIKRVRNKAHHLKDPVLGKNFMLKVINEIVKYMFDNDINFNYIAKKLGVSRASVSIMFSGRVMWTFMTMINVCDAIGLDFQLVLTPRIVKL